MTDLIAKKISEKAGIPQLLQVLSTQLSSSDLSSLLLEVYQQKAGQVRADTLLQQYRQNIFAQPATTDMVQVLEKELQVLRYLQQHHYQPLELSPVAQFGSCSAVGTVSQKKIISAIRNTEVQADATNALALHIAALRQAGSSPQERMRYCTVHRHIRVMQLPPLKGYTPHFKVACMVAAGKDTGNFAFERVSLQEQLLHIYELLSGTFGLTGIRVKLLPREGYKQGAVLLDAQLKHLSGNLPFEVQADHTASPNNYYKGIQFKIMAPINGQDIEIADGGFVDWTQQLLGNNKERCLISGIGLSLLVALTNT